MVRGKAMEAELAPKRPKRATKENGDAPLVGHNLPKVIADPTERNLFIQHVRMYQEALAEKKDRDANFRNQCKKIRKEGEETRIDDIKFWIDLLSDGGNKKYSERMKREAKIAAWYAEIGGTQGDLWMPPPAKNTVNEDLADEDMPPLPDDMEDLGDEPPTFRD